MKDEERITELEILLAHQQDLLQELNDVLIGQQTAVDKLRLEVDRLKEIVTGLIRTDPQDDSPPPHY